MVSQCSCLCVQCLCPFAFLHVNLIMERQRGDMAWEQGGRDEGRKIKEMCFLVWKSPLKKKQSLFGGFHGNGDISDGELLCVLVFANEKT